MDAQLPERVSPEVGPDPGAWGGDTDMSGKIGTAMAERNNSMSDKAEDRRDSPRIPMRLKLRRAGSSADFEEREGDLSLGGCAWNGPGLEAGAQVEARFKLPILPDEVEAKGEVLHVTEGPQGPTVHVRFADMPVEAELAIARHLDDMRLAGEQH
ncbi:PilZ domain-containing protein [Myxococcus stipitatus]|uniref:PilZ domain-containing protein n=1 Tax=Myxococcus stipitatus TaxID=83455 RepID=UPI0030CFD392